MVDVLIQEAVALSFCETHSDSDGPASDSGLAVADVIDLGEWIPVGLKNQAFPRLHERVCRQDNGRREDRRRAILDRLPTADGGSNESGSDSRLAAFARDNLIDRHRDRLRFWAEG